MFSDILLMAGTLLVVVLAAMFIVAIGAEYSKTKKPDSNETMTDKELFELWYKK